jgi:outer membrane protein
MKKMLFIVVILVGVSWSAASQQLTRFAVVDLSRVYMSFFRESRAVREFEEQSALVQSELDRMTREIQDLKNAQFAAQSQGNRSQVTRLENEIYQKSEYLKEYYQLKTAELEDRKSKLSQSGPFLDQVYGELRSIAESEGYSIVLNLNENKGILWYSPVVDITDQLIRNLLSKVGR